MTEPSVGEQIAEYVAGAPSRAFPPHILDEAKKCLVDWLGVCLAAHASPEARMVRQVAQAWGTRGKARMLTGGSAAPVAAALVNGTLSHCLDFDDTHIPSVLHASGPIWAAVLAVGMQRGASEKALLQSFITGFEVGTRLGADGLGVRLNDNGWHATPVLGRFAAAAALGALLELKPLQLRHALGLAGTQAGGLTASFGTMAKPFHAGKAAMDAILAVELAEQGYEAATGLLDGPNGCLQTLFQDRALRVRLEPFDAVWEITRNSFKPYAACQLAHAPIDAALAVRAKLELEKVERLRVFVHPLAVKIAGLRNARTATEGKFSIAFCVALGLHGRSVTMADFTDEHLGNPVLRALADRVETVASEGIERTAARLEVTLRDGTTVIQEVPHAFGSIGNPMGWNELHAKFIALTQPLFGQEARNLVEILRRFEQPGSLIDAFRIIDRWKGEST